MAATEISIFKFNTELYSMYPCSTITPIAVDRNNCFVLSTWVLSCLITLLCFGKYSKTKLHS